MYRYRFIFIATLIATLQPSAALPQSAPSFSLLMNYTTSASIYPYGTPSGTYGKVYSLPVESIAGYSAAVSYPTGYFDLSLQLNMEYQHSKISREHTFLTDSGTRSLPVSEGYSFIPLELSLLYLLPFSSGRFEFSLGGGGGVYFGRYLREYNGKNLCSTKNELQYGLHVQFNVLYRPKNYFCIIAGMKFRDPDLILRNSYVSSTIQDGAQTIFLTPEQFTSRVNIDGTVFFAGVGYAFGAGPGDEQ